MLSNIQCIHCFVHCGGSVGRIDRLLRTTKAVVQLLGSNVFINPTIIGGSGSWKQVIPNVPLRFILQERREFMDPQYGIPAFLSLLLRFRSHDSTDYRDKVYGLVSLIKGYQGKDFIVDYDLSTRDVYKGVARYIIEGSEKLDIIEYAYEHRCTCDRSTHISFGLPSWVPNWTCRRQLWSLFGSNSVNYKAAYSIPANVVFSHDSSATTCQGISIGIIERIYHIYQGFDHLGDPEIARKVLRDNILFVNPSIGSSHQHQCGPNIDVSVVSTLQYELLILSRGFHEVEQLPLETFARMCSVALNDSNLEDALFWNTRIGYT